MQPGHPGQDPYGQQPSHDPYGQPGQGQPYGQQPDPYAQPPQAPYGQQPHDPYAAPQAPYGQQPTSGQPYGQPVSGDPYAPTSGQPYGQPYQDPYAQQQPYGAPTYPNAGYPQAGGQQNTLGLVSMILGIAAIPMLCCFFVGIPLGIAAVVTGWLGKQKADQGLASNGGQAKAGLICGAVAIGLGLLLIVLNVVANVALPTQP
ncbi:DUF4190 domain-containing protein [Micromonospora coxensis]|uniref:DUF4190 domain-containing protein n=1 Tax=Micromonospora coxensis TaxID=356852 RepID=A0A1C5I8K2_9ACTN|nr:DUF4190 domain-containing protein [Micromonospora coxensis]SCG54485.1 hypothetical protein GA0070614_2386 [Micromonospora coxensis]